jgi:hypothetical protein
MHVAEPRATSYPVVGRAPLIASQAPGAPARARAPSARVPVRGGMHGSALERSELDEEVRRRTGFRGAAHEVADPPRVIVASDAWNHPMRDGHRIAHDATGLEQPVTAVADGDVRVTMDGRRTGR